MVTEAINEPWVVKQIHASAKQAARKHEGYVDFDDLVQEGYLYLLEHPELIDEHTKTSERVVGRSVFYEMNRYGLRQRYRKDGTSPDDYFRYTAAIVETLIGDVLDGGVYPQSSGDMNSDGRSGKSPAYGFDFEAMMADISQAFKRLNETDKGVLLEKYRGGDVNEEVLALTHGVSAQAIRKRVQRALVRLAKMLNGDYAPKAMRHVTNNATAQVRTRRQEESR